ncbi:MAG: trimeric intracellular cation channel family protein, partial [Janthinobacterium lividum]
MSATDLAIVGVRPLVAALDYAGVAVFAVSGALAAARAKRTIVTFAFFAAVTGIGGGTLRDLLIGAPVFWVYRSDYLGICLVAAALVWLLRADGWK